MLVPALRPARPADLYAINAIYNHYVRHSTCTYQIEPDSIAERRRWFAIHDSRHPVLVAEVKDEVVAWGALSRYHARCAYDRTVEDSVYVRRDLRGRGLGRSLLSELLARARALQHHAVLALIDAEQPASVRLHESFGFQSAGRLREVGFKRKRWLDVVIYQLLL
jgi:phosphinothricin acetyltransferase